ncbi:sigma-70 family RNA polymerase sigma factor [Chitinophaga pendula]|uniref:RNA polymerase sigma factor n=1 Tax=Chitinophaga TaxID=79328 RepID=UPI000BAF3324|nr:MULTISPECIES: sigma-70 family RNA polymerase sigma factor [Chitinophaga]ASZ10200.1 RNA polymerase sigma-70 factor [Chitinophaga sp. MD30]UCJ06843.1 sigma-70 family RNA polymerase sigma factor [Chitinophaga pendula]
MQDYSDLDLWGLIRQGDTAAFGVLYERKWETLYHTVYWRVLSQEDTQDILHDIFCRFWEKRQQINITDTVDGYFRTAARFSVLNHLRAKGLRERHMQLSSLTTQEQSDSTTALTHAQELKRLYEEQVNLLPEKMKVIYLLSREEHQTIEAIAKRLSISPQTVKNQVSSALKKIRAGLAGYEFFVLLTGDIKLLQVFFEMF